MEQLLQLDRWPTCAQQQSQHWSKDCVLGHYARLGKARRVRGAGFSRGERWQGATLDARSGTAHHRLRGRTPGPQLIEQLRGAVPIFAEDTSYRRFRRCTSDPPRQVLGGPGSVVGVPSCVENANPALPVVARDASSPSRDNALTHCDIDNASLTLKQPQAADEGSIGRHAIFGKARRVRGILPRPDQLFGATLANLEEPSYRRLNRCRSDSPRQSRGGFWSVVGALANHADSLTVPLSPIGGNTSLVMDLPTYRDDVHLSTGRHAIFGPVCRARGAAGAPPFEQLHGAKQLNVEEPSCRHLRRCASDPPRLFFGGPRSAVGVHRADPYASRVPCPSASEAQSLRRCDVPVDFCQEGAYSASQAHRRQRATGTCSWQSNLRRGSVPQPPRQSVGVVIDKLQSRSRELETWTQAAVDPDLRFLRSMSEFIAGVRGVVNDEGLSKTSTAKHTAITCARGPSGSSHHERHCHFQHDLREHIVKELACAASQDDKVAAALETAIHSDPWLSWSASEPPAVIQGTVPDEACLKSEAAANDSFPAVLTNTRSPLSSALRDPLLVPSIRTSPRQKPNQQDEEDLREHIAKELTCIASRDHKVAAALEIAIDTVGLSPPAGWTGYRGHSFFGGPGIVRTADESTPHLQLKEVEKKTSLVMPSNREAEVPSVGASSILGRSESVKVRKLSAEQIPITTDIEVPSAGLKSTDFKSRSQLNSLRAAGGEFVPRTWRLLVSDFETFPLDARQKEAVNLFKFIQQAEAQEKVLNANLQNRATQQLNMISAL